MAAMMVVLVPMARAVSQILASKKAKPTPTTIESMLVAMAVMTVSSSVVSVRFLSAAAASSSSSSSCSAPQIIFSPNANSRPNASQWSYSAMNFCVMLPTSQPMSGVMVSTMPKISAVLTVCRQV